MSTFSKGDKVRCIETWTTYVIDSGDEFTVDDVRGTVSGVQQVFVQGEWVPARYFEMVEPEELADWERALLAEVDAEDADDAYVEPEPLKEGDWVQVWAKVHDPSPKDDELVELRIRIRGGGMATAYTIADAIVRPDAGQVPPWVKPTEEPEPSASEVIMAVLTQSSAEMARRMQVFADAAEEFGRRLREQIEGHGDSEDGAS